MAYNPYSDIQKVYNAKTAWNTATTDEERKRQNEIANAARKRLNDYGYSDVANQISASGADATAARKILEQYAPKSATKVTTKAITAPDSTTLSNPELITVNNNETRNKINQLWGTQTSDRDMMTGKYNKLEDTAYSNPFETDEAKAILKQYDLKAMQGRENEKASGAASNGGNIDSFAAANALRQQAILINKGQMVALDAHNNKINNVKGILADLGVYLQNQDKGMQSTIGIQQEEGQRLFENDQTAKNNEVARLSEQASVTGYTPTEWTIKNDATYSQFLNPDGTFKKEMENVDIQALINNTTDTDTKKKLAVIRAKKMLGNYGEYGQYINQGDVAFMDKEKTEAADQFDKQTDMTLKSLGIESDLAKYEIDTKKLMADNENATNLALQEKKGKTTDYTLDDVVKMLKNTKTPSQELIDLYNSFGIDATQYTPENPPPMTGANIEDEGDDYGDNDNDTGDDTGDDKPKKDIFTTWEDEGVTFKTFTVKGVDNDKLNESGVDEYGKKAIINAISAVTNGDIGTNGIVSNYDLAEYLISNSNTNNTNKNQLKKVFGYFGLDANMLKQIEDSGFWFWEWDKGTNIK